MDLRRLRAGEWLLAASGVLLLVSLCMDWYRLPAVSGIAVRAGDGEAGRGFSGFEALSVIDLVAAALALSALAVVLLTALCSRVGAPVAAAALLTPVAGLVALIVLIRVLEIPDPRHGLLDPGREPVVEVMRQAWSWVGFAATAGVFAGAARAMRDERRSSPGRPTDQTGRPITGKQTIEAIATPPAGRGS